MSKHYNELRLELSELNLSALELLRDRIQNYFQNYEECPEYNGLENIYKEEELHAGRLTIRLRAVEDTIKEIKKHMALEEREAK